MRFYTWKDIERSCFIYKGAWEEKINAIDVYPDEIILNLKENVSENMALEVVKNIFPKNISVYNKTFTLDRDAAPLRISFERDYERREKKLKPLFEQVIYSKSAYPSETLNELECPVIAFHSYKGGVGRTLSLLAFAKAWTSVNGKKADDRILIIDSDIEAPGLTWIQGGRYEDTFSYLDLLTLIQDSDDVDEIVDAAAKEIDSLYIPFESEQQVIQHIFLPTFRYDEQLFDLYASPDSVIKGRNKEYMLAEILSKIAVRVNASLVLVDLRAGISEYSAPLLFDQRVKKYFVTSTSSQSVIGTEKLLKYISKGLPIMEESNLPTIFLNMVPPNLGKDEKDEIIKQLVNCFETNEENAQLLDNMVVEFPFASELVHLTDIHQILDNLKDRKMLTAIEKIVAQSYGQAKETVPVYSGENRSKVLKQIYEFSNQQITAESNGTANLLLTEPIKNLCTRFKNRIPIAVVRGAKGSGKTFLYRQLIERGNWDAFCNSINDKPQGQDRGYFVPIFASRNMIKLNRILSRCIDKVNKEVTIASVSKTVYLENSRKLEDQVLIDTDWITFWEQLFTESVSDEISNFGELEHELKQQNQKIVFIVDGLEEILKNVSTNTKQQKAIQILCQDFINLLAVKYDNIGIILFLRSDMAKSAITVNYEQFNQIHDYSELKWSSEEALRLAVWVVAQAVDGFYTSTVPIGSALKDVIDAKLEEIWGLKLGKRSSNEAYSSKWILAALSDFNGQLQARDMIRFLKEASKINAKNPAYKDRILMPTEVRKAVSECSKAKIEEIKMEYADLEPIFNKLDQLPSEKKLLPLNLGEDALTATEEKLMRQEGYLAGDGEKLYLPEIVRHALGFKYFGGARPKVLSLLLKH